MKEKFYPVDVVRKIPSRVLSATEKLTLILLLDYLNCKEIYVSAERIASEASLSVPTVERAFRKFKRMKIMSTQRTRRGATFLYLKTFNIAFIRALASQPVEEPTTLEIDDPIEIDLNSL